MTSIVDWLDEHISDSALAFTDDAELEQQADIVRAKAEAAGYSADDLNRACGGDIADYIRSRTVSAGAEDADGKMAGDLSPILTPGFNQQ